MEEGAPFWTGFRYDAGMTILRSGISDFGSGVPFADVLPSYAAVRLMIPQGLRVDESRVLYQEGEPVREVSPPRTLLADFMGLASARFQHRAVERLATSLGPLGICQHGVALAACPGCTPCWPGWPEGSPAESGGVYFEPVEEWLILARQVRSLFVAAKCLTTGERIPPFHAEHIGRVGEFLVAPSAQVPLQEKRRLLAWQLNGWVVGSGVRLALSWIEDGRRIAFAYSGLRSALAAQLLSALGGPLAICASCGTMFQPSRQPAPGQRTWCQREACRRARDAQVARDYRARQRRLRTSPTRARVLGKRGKRK